MTIFLSYCRKDEALAHFLAYVLEKGGITCELDRKVLKGRAFDQSLRNMIREADLVLVLLTERSRCSQWVNQEIGFATGLQKIVYPLVVERDVEPEGMLQMCEKYSLLDWSDPQHTIDRLIRELKAECSRGTAIDELVPLSKYLEDQVARAQFLVEWLKKLVKDRDPDMAICQQAAFSIFATSEESLYRECGHHSQEYFDLLLEERRLTHELVMAADTKYRLIIWPVRDYDRRYQSMRFQNLLTWLREVESDPTIEFRCGPFRDPKNRLIVPGQFVLDGFKPRRAAGFDLSHARFEKKQIAEAQDEFESTWARLRHNKGDAISFVEKMSKNLHIQE